MLWWWGATWRDGIGWRRKEGGGLGTLTNRKVGRRGFCFVCYIWGRRGVGGECAFVSGILLA